MSLGFLGAGLLATAALCAVPLIIHLISRRQPRRVPFAAMEFVLRSQKRTARNFKLQKLLLLAVRTLLIAALAMAVAQPILSRDKAADQADQVPLVVVVAVDASASMRARVDGRTRFNLAKQHARETVEHLAQETQVALVLCDRNTDVVRQPSFDKRAALDAIDAMRVGFDAVPLEGCVQSAVGVAASVDGQGTRQVVLVSDLAAHGVTHANKAGASVDGLVVRFVPTDDDELANHAVHHADVTRKRQGAAGDVEVAFGVTRFAGKTAEAALDLYVDDKRVAQRTLELANKTPVQGTFHFHQASVYDDDVKTAARAQQRTVRLVAEDDALAEDNTLAFPVELPAPVQVLLVDGAPQPIPFRDEVYYLESALKKSAAHRTPLVVQTLLPDDVTPAVLLDADVVVLANVARLSDDVVKSLVGFVRGGGGLWVTAGDQVDVVWMNRALGSVLPGQLRGEKDNQMLDDNVTQALAFSGFDRRHPIFRPIQSEQKNVVKGLANAQTTKLMLLEPDARIEKKVLLRFDNGAPALVERSVDEGRVLLWLTTMDRDWSDAAIRPGFLPLVQQAVLHLAGQLHDAHSRLVDVGAVMELPVPKGATALFVDGPDGKRSRVDLTGRKADDDTPAVFRDVRLPGIHKLFVEVDGGEPRELVHDRFAARMPLSESDLRQASLDQLQTLAPQGARVEGGPAQRDQPLWPFFLLALPGLLLVESVLVRKQ